MEWNSPAGVSMVTRGIDQGIDLEEVRRLYLDEGLSTYGIAERFGVSRTFINNIMCRCNIPRRTIAGALALRSGRTLTIKERNKTHHFCPGCGERKPIDEFYRNVAKHSGLATYCKQCCRESRLKTGGKLYQGLHKRPFPLDNKCEICSVELDQNYDSHHFNDNNLSLVIYVCSACDYLAEGLDEINKNPWKVNIYRRLKEEVEEGENSYVYLGPFKPPDGIYKLFLNGEQTYKWCPHCGELLPVEEFYKRPSKYRIFSAWCKECWQGSHLSNGREAFSGLHKRPKPDHCELCGDSKAKIDYHHWDKAETISARSKGVWVCGNHSKNRCHNLAEAVDVIDSGSPLPDKYYELKQRINQLEGNHNGQDALLVNSIRLN